jgi:hypothetical protein
VSETLAQQICSLPIFPGMSEAELDQVVEAVASFAVAATPAAHPGGARTNAAASSEDPAASLR